MKIEKPSNCSQEDASIANPKISSDSHGEFSAPNEEMKKRQYGEDGEAKVSVCDDEPLTKHSEVDMKSSIEMNAMDGPKDDEGSEYSLLRNEVDSGNLCFECKINNESIDGKVNTSEQPKSESSSSSSANFVLPASSNDSYQESTVDARTFQGNNINNANTSSMSSSCTDLGYHPKEIKVSSMEPGITAEIQPLREKLTDASETICSKKRGLELAKEEVYADINLKDVSGVNNGHQDVGEREQSTLSGIDLNEEVAHSIEVEQETTACNVKNVRKPIPIFARREGQGSTPEIWFKGLGNGGWKGSASTTSAFRPTCHFKDSDNSGKKRVKWIDLNVDAGGIESVKDFPNHNEVSEEACSMQDKFSIDLNAASENDESFQSSRTVRDFDLNCDPMAAYSYVQEESEPSLGKEAIDGHEICILSNVGVPESCNIGPVPRMTSVPVVLRVPEQAENATRPLLFHRSVCIEPQNPVFSLTSSLNVPLYPVHLNGIPAFHGGPNLIKAPSGPGPYNVLRVVSPYNLYDGMNLLGNASSEGTGMQVLATPMHPTVAQQLNDFQQRGFCPSRP